MKCFIKVFYVVVGLILIPGCCSRYIDYAKKTFNQAQDIKFDLSKARLFLRSKREYDQFTTVGLFDVLWFNKDVQEVYKKIKLERLGVLDNNLENFDKYITFYLLLPPKDLQDIVYTHFDGITYSQGNIDWKVHLEINGKKYAPKEFKCLNELDPELILIFGKSANRYRSIYIANFELESNDHFKLIVSSTRYTIQFNW